MPNDCQVYRLDAQSGCRLVHLHLGCLHSDSVIYIHQKDQLLLKICKQPKRKAKIWIFLYLLTTFPFKLISFDIEHWLKMSKKVTDLIWVWAGIFGLLAIKTSYLKTSSCMGFLGHCPFVHNRLLYHESQCNKWNHGQRQKITKNISFKTQNSLTIFDWDLFYFFKSNLTKYMKWNEILLQLLISSIDHQYHKHIRCSK